MHSKNKVIVIGIDGATFDVILPIVKEGKFPNIGRLMDEGCCGELDSTVPILSPVAWTSFATGVNPGKHGIFDFLTRQENTYQIIPTSSTQRLIKPLWKVAGEMGKRVAILNMPATFPPDDVNGVMIAGEPTPFHDGRKVSPTGIYKELVERFGKNSLVPPRFRSERLFLKNLLHSVELWTEVSRYIMERENWDLFIVIFTASDVAQHFFWKYMDKTHPQYDKKSAEKFNDAIYKVYKKLDWAVGELVGSGGEDSNIVIVSDHGFGPLYKTIPITDWLVKNGYLLFKDGSGCDRKGNFMDLMRFVLWKFGVMGRRPPPSTLNEVDWSRTKVYFLGSSDALYINLHGREPEGIVSPGREYHQLIEEVTSKLEGMSLSGRLRPVEKVYKGSELCPSNSYSPDLFIRWRKGFGMFREGDPLRRLRRLTPHRWSGDHTNKGIFIMKGPSVLRTTIKGARIVDVAPTIYHLLGMPVPVGLDGRVLSETLNEESLMHLSYSHIDIRERMVSDIAYTDSDTQIVAERLKDLGYMD